MNGEYLSLETSEKLARYEKAIKYLEEEIAECFRSGDCRNLKIYEEILNILEIEEDERKNR